MNSAHADEITAGTRFQFGRNWRLFLELVDEHRIELAIESLRTLLGKDDLTQCRFLDIGSGSGLFSLAARRLGAEVTSFDFDPQSVACTVELRRRFAPQDTDWHIEQASVLDHDVHHEFGRFDIVYSWGVLHHTGQMWRGLENAAQMVAPGGTLALAIYNDQGRASNTWLRIKELYNWLPRMLRGLVLLPCLLRLWGPTSVRDVFRGRPFHSWRHYADESVRGMSPWYDLVDWVGGLPFEVAKPEELLHYYRAQDFSLVNLKTCAGGIGCNEYVFEKKAEQSA